jgi:hypothetical protein
MRIPRRSWCVQSHTSLQATYQAEEVVKMPSRSGHKWQRKSQYLKLLWIAAARAFRSHSAECAEQINSPNSKTLQGLSLSLSMGVTLCWVCSTCVSFGGCCVAGMGFRETAWSQVLWISRVITARNKAHRCLAARVCGVLQLCVFAGLWRCETDHTCVYANLLCILAGDRMLLIARQSLLRNKDTHNFWSVIGATAQILGFSMFVWEYIY